MTWYFDIMNFCNTSLLEIWTFWLLVTLCRIQRGFNITARYTVVCNQQDESLIGQHEHNTNQGFLLVSFLWYQKVVFWQISNIIIKSVFRFFLYLNPSTVHVVLNWYLAHTLIKLRCKIELVHEIQTKNLLTSLCIHLNHCPELLSKRLEGNFQIYLE